mgnify:CR=1 FL=1
MCVCVWEREGWICVYTCLCLLFVWATESVDVGVLVNDVVVGVFMGSTVF